MSTTLTKPAARGRPPKNSKKKAPVPPTSMVLREKSYESYWKKLQVRKYNM